MPRGSEFQIPSKKFPKVVAFYRNPCYCVDEMTTRNDIYATSNRPATMWSGSFVCVEAHLLPKQGEDHDW